METATKFAFDSLVGYEGAAETEGWQAMSDEELVANAVAHVEHYYGGEDTYINEMKLLKAIKAYKDARGTNEAFYAREILSEN